MVTYGNSAQTVPQSYVGLVTMSGGVVQAVTQGPTLANGTYLRCLVPHSGGGNIMVFANAYGSPWQCVMPDGTAGPAVNGLWPAPAGTHTQTSQIWSVTNNYDTFYWYFWDSATSTPPAVYPMNIDSAGNITGGPAQAGVGGSSGPPWLSVPTTGSGPFFSGGPYPVTNISGAMSPQLVYSGGSAVWDEGSYTLSGQYMYLVDTETFYPDQPTSGPAAISGYVPWEIIRNYWKWPSGPSDGTVAGYLMFLPGSVVQWGDYVACIGFVANNWAYYNHYAIPKTLRAEVLAPCLGPMYVDAPVNNSTIVSMAGAWSIGKVLVGPPVQSLWPPHPAESIVAPNTTNVF
jgi:hypothetical protein